LLVAGLSCLLRSLILLMVGRHGVTFLALTSIGVGSEDCSCLRVRASGVMAVNCLELNGFEKTTAWGSGCLNERRD
jgi:hypothetical protein